MAVKDQPDTTKREEKFRDTARKEIRLEFQSFLICFVFFLNMQRNADTRIVASVNSCLNEKGECLEGAS